MDSQALKDVSVDSIESRIPCRTVASLRDIEVLYGALYTLGRDLTGEYGPYLTPDTATEQVGTESLMTIRVDLRGGTATLADPPVTREMFPKTLIPCVAHSKYSPGRADDHSITHQSGQSSEPELQGSHATNRLSSWPTHDSVKKAASDHTDGWMIEELAAMGADESVQDTIQEAVESRVSEDGQLLHTVAVAFDESDYHITTTDEFRPTETFHYPGEIEVFQEAMATRKTQKFRVNKQGTDDAAGSGTCYVFDSSEEVYGIVDDPMNHYLSKKMEKFPALNADRSWQTQGLSREAAVLAQNASTFLDACAISAPGTSAFYLPYPAGQVDAESAKALYELLSDQVNSDDDYSPIGETYRQLKSDGTLEAIRFSLLIVVKENSKRWRVLAATPTASTYTIESVTQSHLEMLDSRWVGQNGVFPRIDAFPLLGATGVESLSNIVSSVKYLGDTCLGESSDDPSNDDFRFRGTANIAGGTPLHVNELLTEYVAKLSDKFDPDGQYPFPSATLAQQYVQLNALRSCEMLIADDERLTRRPQPMSDQSSQTAADGRTERFNQYIDDHPALSDTSRQGIFALGALVGRISRYQNREGKGTTAVNKYPIGNLTTHNIRRIATQVVEKNVIYSEEEGYNGTMYAELMDAVVDGLESTDPTTLTLSTADIRFHYAMGIAYGKNDTSTSDYDNE